MRSCSSISVARWLMVVAVAVGTSFSLFAVLTLAITALRMPDEAPKSPSNIVLAVVTHQSASGTVNPSVSPDVVRESAPGQVHPVVGLLIAIAATLIGFALLVRLMHPT